MKKHIKLISALLPLVLSFAIFSGCSQENEPERSTGPTTENLKEDISSSLPEFDENNLEDPNKLTVYFSDLEGMSTCQLLTVCAQSKKISPSDILNPKTFNYTDDMETQLVPELMAGGGPDIFIFNSNTLPNYKNYARQGLFVDLNEFIEEDQSLDLTLYNQSVLNIGVWEEKRYYIPLGFYPFYFYTTQQMCDKYDITIPEDGVSYEKMPEVFHNYIEQEKGQKLTVYTDELLKGRSYQYIDPKTQTCSFDSEQFQEEMKWFLTS